MRAVLGFVILLLLTGPLAAEEGGPGRAPTEKAALSATRNFLRALGEVTGGDRPDMLARYVDTQAFTSRVFGKALEGLSSTQRVQLDGALHRTLSDGLFETVRYVTHVDGMSFKSSELPGGLRRVSFWRMSEVVSVVWALGTRAPQLVDFGSPRRGFLSVTLARRWKKSGQAPGAFLASLTGKSGRRARQLTISKDNIKSLITFMLVRRMGKVSGAWPAYSGKAFVLSGVLTRDLDPRDPESLETLFSPADRVLSLARVGTERYRDITRKALKSGSLDVSDLTSYAGRRNAESGMQITPDNERGGTPLIADLSFGDVAIVGFSNGSVRVFTRKELGLGPKDPIVVGDKAKSEILRVLSDK